MDLQKKAGNCEIEQIQNLRTQNHEISGWTAVRLAMAGVAEVLPHR
jgi:hypothetical protein